MAKKRRIWQDPATGEVRMEEGVDVSAQAPPMPRFYDETTVTAQAPPMPRFTDEVTVTGRMPPVRRSEGVAVDASYPAPAPMSTPGLESLRTPRPRGIQRAGPGYLADTGSLPRGVERPPTRRAGPGYLADVGSVPQGVEEMRFYGPMSQGAAGPGREARRGAPGAGMGFAAAGIRGASDRQRDLERSDLVGPDGLIRKPPGAKPWAKPYTPDVPPSATEGVATPPDSAKDVQEQTSVSRLSAPGARLEAPGGYAMVESRSPGGSGEAWVREQAGRQQGPQVYGFDASEIPRPSKPSGGIAAAVEPTSDEQGALAAGQPVTESMPWRDKPGMAAIQGTPDERDRGVWGIPQGIRRSPAPPGAQARWQSEFQDAEKARYARRDTEDAGIAAEMARQQALTQDPFAEMGAETAAKKELLGAEFEGQKGLFGAQEEAKYATEEKRGKAYQLGANIEQDRYQSELAKIEASDLDDRAKEELLAKLEYEHGIKMQVLQARHFQETEGSSP